MKTALLLLGFLTLSAPALAESCDNRYALNIADAVSPWLPGRDYLPGSAVITLESPNLLTLTVDGAAEKYRAYRNRRKGTEDIVSELGDGPVIPGRFYEIPERSEGKKAFAYRFGNNIFWPVCRGIPPVAATEPQGCDHYELVYPNSAPRPQSGHDRGPNPGSLEFRGITIDGIYAGEVITLREAGRIRRYFADRYAGPTMRVAEPQDSSEPAVLYRWADFPDPLNPGHSKRSLLFGDDFYWPVCGL